MVLPLDNVCFVSVKKALRKGGPDALGWRQIQGVHPKETADLEAPGCSFPSANGGAQRMTNIK